MVLLFLSLSAHFFLPFHIPSCFIALTTYFQRDILPFFCHALFFFRPFLPPLSFICLFCSILLPVLPLLTSLFSGASDLFLLQNRPFRLCCPPTRWFYRLFSECKADKHEIAHKPESSASGKNDWSSTSILPIRVYDLDRDNFTCFYLLQQAPTQCQPHSLLAVSSIPIPSQTEMHRRMVSTSLHIRVARFNLDPETIKHESLRDFSQSLEPNDKIIPLRTLQMCLNISFQIQYSSTILKFDAISSETLTAQNP